MRRFILASILSLCASFSYGFPQFERIEIDRNADARKYESAERERDPEYQKRMGAARCAFGMCKTYPWQADHSKTLILSNRLWETPSQRKRNLVDLATDSSLKKKPGSSLRRNIYIGDQSFTAMWNRATADAELETVNRDHPEILSLRIQHDPEGTNRYGLYDGQPLPVHEGSDIGEIVARACDELDRGKSGVVMGFAGFSEKEGRAFAAEFSVQNELHNGKAAAWSSIVGADGELLALYRTAGMKLDGVILDKPQAGWWRVRSRFTNGLRFLWVQTWLSGRQYLKEFVASVFRSTSSLRSPEQAVGLSKRQLIANHPEFTEQQIYLGIRQEIRQSHLGEVLRREREAA